jgi:hypothetical protein
LAGALVDAAKRQRKEVREKARLLWKKKRKQSPSSQYGTFHESQQEPSQPTKSTTSKKKYQSIVNYKQNRRN